nr:hypothetical transcript [Hymenolepis microstoma]
MNVISGFPIDGSYEYTKTLFSSRCTHIIGNLIIYGLHPSPDGKEPDLDFLKSIEEISGFLIIMNSSIREIPFSSLKVIRGLGGGYKIHEDLPPAALLIRHNYDSNRILYRINFSQLKAIENGDVYMFDNPAGCDLVGGLVFKNLFTNPAEQRFHNSLDLDLPIFNSSLNEPCQSPNPGALVEKHMQ